MKKNKFVNFLYYNKLKIAGSILLILIVIFSIKECSVKKQYDFGVLYVAVEERANTDKFNEALKNTGTIEDIDGKDGINIITKTIYIPNDVKVMRQQGIPEQIMVELSSGDCTLFILDKETVYEQKHLDVFFDLKELADKYEIPEEKRYIDESGSVIAISLEGNKFLNENGAPCDSLYMAIKNHKSGSKSKTILNAIKTAEYILSEK